MRFDTAGAILVALAIVALLALWVRLCVYPMVRVSAVLLRSVWRARAGLNPATSPGRWRILGLSIISCALWFFLWLRDQRSFGLDLFDVHGPAEYAIAMLIGLVVGVAGVGFLYVTVVCFAHAKRFDAVPASGLRDVRPPVLYLRSFDDDRRTSRHIGLAGFKTNTEEGEIAEIVSRIGPFVAVGRPGESLSYFGAARVSLQHADWQDGVRQLMATAQLVFLRIGGSPGLLWELDEAVRTVRPEKLVLLIPLNRREYDEFCERTRGSFPCQLPEYQGRRIPITSIRAVVCFDHEWIPSIVPVQQTKREYWRRAAASALSTDVFFRTRSKLRDVLDDTLGPIVRRAMDVSSARTYAAK